MPRLLLLLALLALAVGSQAEVTRYTSQVAFEAALGAMGITAIHEGFEDDAAWGQLRSPNTAYTVSNQGINWTANSVNCGLTTGTGPVRTGVYGFYELPHGDWQNNITDGWVIAGDDTLYGAGGWIETNTYGARINLILDGITIVDFEDVPLDYAHQFYGVIEPLGFTSIEITETEANPTDEWFYIFADDFYFGMPSGTAVPGDEIAAATVRLLQNVPNPFNPSTSIRFELDASASVEIQIFDTQGRRVRRLMENQQLPAGSHAVAWDGRSDGGQALPSGVYLYRLNAGPFSAMRRMTLLK